MVLNFENFFVLIGNFVGFCLSRFDECGISPLTVKALSAAGYVQMTRVQEATLSACLEGMLAASLPFWLYFASVFMFTLPIA